MIFNTWEFLAFGVLVLGAYWLVVPPAWRPMFLAVAGIVFYSAWIPAYTVLILVLSAVTYAAARGMLASTGRRARWYFLAGLLASVAVLVFFKYTKFLVGSFAGLCHGGCRDPLPDIAVPLAVSFFTFEFVHLLVDVRLGKIRTVRARDFTLFALFFPTMVAGPIKRYQAFVPQIDRVAITPLVAVAGLHRVALGLAKKMIVADSMDPLLVPLSAPSALFATPDYWLAALAYTVKIYFDFTGYSDIAIGLSALLGFRIAENFDRPYRSADISQFWRRWHMSLSSWIRDYLFIPLGGSRHSPLRTYANLSLVMALAGLWHGAAWHFVLWGVWHGIGLGVHRVWSALRERFLPALRGGAWKLAATAITFVFVVLGWVLFAAPTVGAALAAYQGMAGYHAKSAPVANAIAPAAVVAGNHAP